MSKVAFIGCALAAIAGCVVAIEDPDNRSAGLGITATQFDLVYDVLSFSLATMMATTIFLWTRVGSVAEKFKSALIISGLVTFIAAYHYIRIFNSWTEAYEWEGNGVTKTAKPFNDAYRYMDWLLTVPLLLIEIILVMKLSPEETSKQGTALGASSALMIILGYPGELVLDESNLGIRWIYWAAAMAPFLYIVKTLLTGLSDATDAEEDPSIRALIKKAQVWTVVSWCTYPFVYILPMFGVKGASAVVGIQLGYSVSDIISKCGVGIVIYQITIAKSAALKAGGGSYGSA